MIPTNNLKPLVHQRRTEILKAFERVMKSAYFVLGPEVTTFEEAFATYIQAKHCVGVASGTDAIELGLRAIGVDRGDQVATVANAGAYTTTAIRSIGAVPRFMEVESTRMLVPLTEVKRVLGERVNAVVVTHLYGTVIPEIRAIKALCEQHAVPLLEDCAQAHGAHLEGRKAGTFGDVGAFSFYPTKNLGALGDGGAVTTDNAAMDARLRSLRQYGWSAKYRNEIPGGKNSRLDEVQAAILSALLPHLDEGNRRRRAIARKYCHAISHPDIACPPSPGNGDVSHLFVVRSPGRDDLKEHLLLNGVGSDIHYPFPDHLQPGIRQYIGKTSLPLTEKLAGEVLSLPCHPGLQEEEVDHIIETTNRWRR